MKITCTCWSCEHVWTEEKDQAPELATCPKCHERNGEILEARPNPDYQDASYRAYGVTMVGGVSVWFEDKEISRDPALGVLVERRNQDSGAVLTTYLLPQDFVERDMNRPGKSIHQLAWKRKLRLRNCKVWKEGAPFETLAADKIQ